eukprot:scaffold68801_cov55-Phaeocystis_antarctica.AAC.1
MDRGRLLLLGGGAAHPAGCLRRRRRRLATHAAWRAVGAARRGGPAAAQAELVDLTPRARCGEITAGGGGANAAGEDGGRGAATSILLHREQGPRRAVQAGGAAYGVLELARLQLDLIQLVLVVDHDDGVQRLVHLLPVGGDEIDAEEGQQRA